MSPITDPVMKELARAIAAEIFSHIGVDVRDPDQLEALRNNLAFLGRMKNGADTVKSAAIRTSVGAFITGIIALVGLGLKDWLFTHLSH